MTPLTNSVSLIFALLLLLGVSSGARAPKFNSPASGTTYHATVGCQFTLEFSAVELTTGNLNVADAAAQGYKVQIDNGLTEVKTPYRNYHVLAGGEVTTKVEGDGRNTGLPLGASLSDRELANPSTRTFTWTPALSQMGKTFRLKLGLRSTGPAGDATFTDVGATYFVDIVVKPCALCPAAGDTFGSLATRYSTQWITIWSANQNVLNPDAPLSSTTPINIGSIYTCGAQDTLASVKSKFGRKENANIIVTNPDMQDAAAGAVPALTDGQKICVIPETRGSLLASS